MNGPVAGFARQHDVLVCDGVSLVDIARSAGTPVHVYSSALLAERYRTFEAAFADYPHHLHYAIKANATLAVVRTLRVGASRCEPGGEIGRFAPASSR
jgi:diaminopimelate decarboxylase